MLDSNSASNAGQVWILLKEKRDLKVNAASNVQVTFQRIVEVLIGTLCTS